MKKIVLAAILLLFTAQGVWAVRVKDLVQIQGVRENKLSGYGLVVGLNGTGDKAGTGTQYTVNALANMLRNMGIQVTADELKMKNVAAVVVTAALPPFARSTQKLDCTVSSMGDATSLAGGTLISAPLYGPDGKVYALAQGPLSVGGFAVSGSSGTGMTKNFPTVGMIPGGAVVERSLDLNLGPQMTLVMNNPDFTTAGRVVNSINAKLGTQVASAADLSTIRLDVPASYQNRLVDFISLVESADVTPDNRARVIVNERTGTVIVGSEVKISSVAIAHGNLRIKVTEQPQVSQPLPLSQGSTTVVPQTGVDVEEGGKRLILLKPGTTIGDLVNALNAVGVSPRDLVVILQGIKRSGALYADLEVI
ncbi:MAG TPA: flagellar basal body P-ring protein FlgI [Deltaproteobacteria bacterium]|nr:flagellar basal body P-ring protein FlgI [Deltaproteobacteria bacterium]HPR55126.1 flagellar basal body P-ring protein FlgI [Deltaproteobacteria bacterium]HXK47292.1 flagellar basal body P-ring protein FlgI [Deltaproteobacteria bacterium]